MTAEPMTAQPAALGRRTPSRRTPSRSTLSRATAAACREGGSATAELVLLTPLLILMLLFMVEGGRLISARLQVDSAASQAARAASLARTPAAATTAATATANGALTSDHRTCARLQITVDTSAFRPGGYVAVTVTCTASLSDLTGLRLPAEQTISSRFVDPLDRYRATA